MSQKVKKSICPIGVTDCAYESIRNGKKLRCKNYNQCTVLTEAWDIPYRTFTINGVSVLEVKSYAQIVSKWEKVSLTFNLDRPQCLLPSGYYTYPDNYLEYNENSQRIKESWLKHGWMAAIPIQFSEDKTKVLNLSEIPF